MEFKLPVSRGSYLLQNGISVVTPSGLTNQPRTGNNGFRPNSQASRPASDLNPLYLNQLA